MEEVTDEDESAEANDNAQQEKQKSKKAKLKLSPYLSNTVTMKSVHFKTTQDIPTGTCYKDITSKDLETENVFCILACFLITVF